MRAYFIGIGGIGMSGVAALAKRLGYEVSGSDKLPLYPPASEILEREGIPIFEPKEENIDFFNPELVIVGNAVKIDHPEVKASFDRGKSLLSFPQFLSEHVFSGKRVLFLRWNSRKNNNDRPFSACPISSFTRPYLLGRWSFKRNSP